MLNVARNTKKVLTTGQQQDVLINSQFGLRTLSPDIYKMLWNDDSLPFLEDITRQEKSLLQHVAKKSSEGMQNTTWKLETARNELRLTKGEASIAFVGLANRGYLDIKDRTIGICWSNVLYNYSEPIF